VTVGSWFPVPEESELPDDLRKLFARSRERLGFVPNVFRAYAYRPERLRAWFTHRLAMATNMLPNEEYAAVGRR
jgi:hypothetical protein